MNHFFRIKPIAYKIGMLILCSFFFFSSAHAWDCHFLITHGALKNTLSKEATIPVEALDEFLTKERKGLIKVLAKQEEWSSHHLEHYHAQPSYLNLKNQEQSVPPQLQFAQAIRINPAMKFPLFIQYPPGEASRLAHNAMNLEQIVVPELINSTSLHIPHLPLEELSSKDLLTPLEILATASDEPDYGMDINLWENSPSWFGKIYGWGDQPFGSKTLSFSSQIPFHMGLYHEAPIVYAVAPYLKKTYSEYRIHQYLSLSRFAFSSGHKYWGYRFLGWALHYAQDLTQPYHSNLSPNISLAKLFYVDVLKLIGITSSEQNLIQLLTNRHSSLENYEYYYLKNSFESRDKHNAALAALADVTIDNHYPAYYDTYPLNVIAKESNLLGDSIDKIISEVFPARYVSDPHYIFYQTESSVNLFELVKNSKNLAGLHQQLNALLSHAGAHTRKMVEFAESTYPNRL